MDIGSVEGFASLVSSFSFAGAASPKHECEICGEAFAYLESLISHRMYKHDNGELRCMRCYCESEELFYTEDKRTKVCKTCIGQISAGDRWEDIMSRYLDDKPWAKEFLVGANEPLSSIFRGSPAFSDSDLKKWSTMRPDKLYLVPLGSPTGSRYNCIWIECDEEQHSQYDKEREEARMMMGEKIIRESLPDKDLYLLIVRWNPDKCKGASNRDTVEQRLLKLENTVKGAFLDLRESRREVVYLYYD